MIETFKIITGNLVMIALAQVCLLNAITVAKENTLRNYSKKK